MPGFEHLWYAEMLGHLSKAEKALNDAGANACQARNEVLFRKIHQKRTEIWDLIKEAMNEGSDKE